MNDQPVQIAPQPRAELLSWCPAWAGEPRKEQRSLSIWIWVPREIADAPIATLADYIEANTGFTVCRSVGWSSGWSKEDPAGLGCVGVTVRSARVRAKLQG